MVKSFVLVALIILCSSCDFSRSDAPQEAIARVNDSYLYRTDVEQIIPNGVSKEDSLVILNNYRDRWASGKLLIEAAEINLNKNKQAELDKLVNQYKLDLYTKAYIEEVVKRSVDTAITSQELTAYYNDNKENFKTNETLVRLRYIQLEKDNPKLETIRRKFLDFRKTDKNFWETNALQFNNYVLNDSVWVEMSQVYSRLPFVNPDNRDKYIVAGKSVQHNDGPETYLVKVTNVRSKGQVAPFEYIKPTLIEVILNKRKLELIKKFEKEITDDAIKSKKYEIFK